MTLMLNFKMLMVAMDHESVIDTLKYYTGYEYLQLMNIFKFPVSDKANVQSSFEEQYKV